MELFRREVLERQAGGQREGDLLRLDPTWTRLAYRLLLVVALAALAFSCLFRVHEYASGPAVVRVDGRHAVTATAGGTVAAVEVQPGQHVEAGQVLVRMVATAEAAELERLTREYDAHVVRWLRDRTSDASVKESLATLKASRDHAARALEARTLRSPSTGIVSDVRIRAGQRLEPGESVLGVMPPDARVSIVAVLPGSARPALAPGKSVRFSLNGYRYEYQDLVLASVGAEVIGPAEVRRYLGQELGDAVPAGGASVLVRAFLPGPTFASGGRTYRYFDGLTGTAEARLRTEPVLVALVPRARELWRR